MPKKVESSRKNHALISARELAGLTQKEAGELLEVSTRTFSRWETNAVQIPNRKWNKFLRLVNLTAADIPKPQEHDAAKYPVNIEPAAPTVKKEMVDYVMIDRARYYRQAAALPGITPEALARAMAKYDQQHGIADDGADLAG